MVAAAAETSAAAAAAAAPSPALLAAFCTPSGLAGQTDSCPQYCSVHLSLDVTAYVMPSDVISASPRRDDR